MDCGKEIVQDIVAAPQAPEKRKNYSVLIKHNREVASDKNTLISMYLKQFKRFVDSIDLRNLHSIWNLSIWELRAVTKCKANSKIVDMTVNDNINKVDDEWTKEEVIDIVDCINTRFAVI